MSKYIEDPNEQLGKLINGGFYFQDKMDERLHYNLCPLCSVSLDSTEDSDLKKCPCCKAIITNTNINKSKN